MPVRIEELVMRTTITEEGSSVSSSNANEQVPNESNPQQLRESLLQDLIALTTERYEEAKER